jgi:hypothetical protein
VFGALEFGTILRIDTMIDKSRQEILQRLDVIEKQVRAIREAIGRE